MKQSLGWMKWSAALAASAGNCSALTGGAPSPLFIESGDTQEPLLKSLGSKLVNSTAKPIRLLYNLTGSCTLINDVYVGNKVSTALSYIPTAAEDPTWDPTKPSPTCTNDIAGGLAIDIGISAVFVASCTTANPPAGTGLITGPIQGYSFVVPKASTQKGVTAEEAYFTFGFGNNDMLDSWNNEMFMFIRPTTKSTLVSLAANIGVPPAKWKGMPQAKSADVVAAVTGSANAEKTIGILGTEIYDKNRATLTLLAYQAYQQKHGYWPDSTPTSFDKRMLRDGHYLPWSPTVYLTAVDGMNVPTNANAKYFIDLVLGNPTTPAFESDGLDSVVSVGLVPDCAMKVSRTFDGGDLSLYSPAQPCTCYYESKVPMGVAPAGCMTCMNDTTCGTGKCRHGYCEAK
jgi:hypothetical protein